MWMDEGYGVAEDMPVIIKRNSRIEIIPIEDLYNRTGDGQIGIEDTSIWSRNGWTNINYCYKYTVEKKIYRIITRMGLIHITGDHSLFYKGIPVMGKDLKIGDKIDLKPLPNIQSNEEIIEAWCNGLFAAEGCANTYRIKQKDGRGYSYMANIYSAKIDLYYDDSRDYMWKKY